ncbi:Translin [Lindgomyces ingoldianus]|uniref:Translin n=1 Tax=Lindgomyces ingoldianus TaxID=673940 RepID=A0ACB6QMC1_9PLEO|nr:Translin [Lindgomyces ingoldianus]KAF2467272.1 Translin [Lindgomyces ingoldianus]
MGDAKHEQPSTPYAAMFEGFRKDLDEHYDRRERVVKASRDITAASKKIIFTLQRLRNIGQPLPPFTVKGNAQYWGTIAERYKAISADLQGLNAYRYNMQITHGNQEFMEAICFQHYIETQTLISYNEAKMRVAAMSGEAGVVQLTVEDYILGIYDMTGEVMKFSITSMATNGKLPAGKPKKGPQPSQEPPSDQPADKMDIDRGVTAQSEEQQPRNVLSDLRELRLRLEMLEPPRTSKFRNEAEKKATVMRESVEKVEKALYNLTVRGSERPKGWVPGVREERRPEVESY